MPLVRPGWPPAIDAPSTSPRATKTDIEVAKVRTDPAAKRGPQAARLYVPRTAPPPPGIAALWPARIRAPALTRVAAPRRAAVEEGIKENGILAQSRPD